MTDYCVARKVGGIGSRCRVHERALEACAVGGPGKEPRGRSPEGEHGHSGGLVGGDAESAGIFKIQSGDDFVHTPGPDERKRQVRLAGDDYGDGGVGDMAQSADVREDGDVYRWCSSPPGGAASGHAMTEK